MADCFALSFDMSPLRKRSLKMKFEKRLLVELLGDKDQVKNVDNPIPIGIGSGFTQTVGNLHQIQDVEPPIAVDISGIWGFEIHLTI